MLEPKVKSNNQTKIKFQKVSISAVIVDCVKKKKKKKKKSNLIVSKYKDFREKANDQI